MKFKSESELAECVIAWLSSQKWDVYQEVQTARGGGVADIVAAQGPVVWVIECKLTFGIAVISQAFSWTPYANYVSVAVPAPTRNTGAESAFARLILKKFGIGNLSIKKWDGESQVNETVPPALNRKASKGLITRVLSDEHKTYAKAGNPNGRRWTPFQSTCRNVLAEVQRRPGICLKDLINSISTHYGSISTARQCLKTWIEAGVVPGVESKRDGRFIRIYPR